MVRWRRDERDARRRMPSLRDPRVHLVRGKLAALTGLGTLRHLDLDVGGVGEVVARHAEPTRRDLLDRAASFRIVEAVGVLATLTRVGAATDAVHRDRDGLVRLGGDRAVAHRACVEARHDRLDRLDLVERHGIATGEVQFEQSAKCAALSRLIVDLVRIRLEHIVASGLGGVLEQEHRLRGEHVQLTLTAVLVFAAHFESSVHLLGWVTRERPVVSDANFLGEFVEPDALDP